MEVDQLIFKRLHRFYKKLTLKKEEPIVGLVELEPLKPKFTIIARAITGKPIEIVTSEREGGWSGYRFFLPKQVYFSESISDNLDFLLFRLFYISTQFNLNQNFASSYVYTAIEAQQKSIEHKDEVLHELFKEFPSTRNIYLKQLEVIQSFYTQKEKSIDYSWLYGRWMQRNLHEFVMEGKTGNSNVKPKENQEITTEKEANPSDDMQVVGVDKKQIENDVLNHNFEKVETASEFNGNFKNMDGDDTLDDHEDAIRELDLKFTVRADDPVHSVYKAEFTSNTTNIVVEAGAEHGFYFSYDEWDFKTRQYKKDFCRLYPKAVHGSNSEYVTTTLKENAKSVRDLSKLFTQIHNDYEKVNRLSFGEEIDLDALTDTYADIQSKITPSEKLYISKFKRKKDLSVLILMDSSLSSDGYTGGLRVLDIEKQAVIMFGEVLNQFDIPFQIDTFSSRSRSNCSYTVIKSFHDNWNNTKGKIGAIQAEGYTRIGPAIRHAGKLMEKLDTPKKWIIMLSDGKPNDYDTYEGKYGIEDVKQAIREINKNHIHLFSLAVEAQAKYYLPLMLGHNNYNILSQASHLPDAFGKFYKKILKNSL